MPAIVSRSQAKSSALLRYFTGTTCKHGHICERQTNNGTCIECRGVANKVWMREKHQERKTWRKGYNSENIERVRQWKVDWRNNNLEKSLEIERSTRKRLIEKDPVGFRERAGIWQKNNPDKVRVKLAQRRGRERQAEGKFTAEDVKSLYKSQDGKCAYCFIAGSNWPDNLQICCPTCNISKGAKDHGEFMQYLGRSV